MLLLALLLAVAGGQDVHAQATGAIKVPPDLTESALIQKISALAQETTANITPPTQFLQQEAQKQAAHKIEALAYIDALLKRFPQSRYTERVSLLQLSTLGDLARVNRAYLGRLMTVTTELSRQHSTGPIAEEADFHAIQAFVLGARLEEMDETVRHMGTLERYKAFIVDHPKSRRAPAIWASMVRNLVQLRRLDEAAARLKEMQQLYPGHQAVQRVAGELILARNFGKPFGFAYQDPDGNRLDTTRYHGQVLVIHFWSTQSHQSLLELTTLSELHSKYKDKGLQLIGINLDRDRNQAKTKLKIDLSWPQFYTDRGIESEVVVRTGITWIPSYLIVDRQGVLRETFRNNSYTDLVKKLLDQPAR